MERRFCQQCSSFAPSHLSLDDCFSRGCCLDGQLFHDLKGSMTCWNLMIRSEWRPQPETIQFNSARLSSSLCGAFLTLKNFKQPLFL
ncbi:hypothetical protein F0562_009184 [Nyssa sinensis]|uniref:Uncharacterized protein n=1 Tax=Nyssa sinensis TaxID=561372 RepID=A0A5J4ZXL8_9ASTE|nr:hypothetical protein F0562_009184 [Nyssa sinensis]